jgi:hypothetical protein
MGGLSLQSSLVWDTHFGCSLLVVVANFDIIDVAIDKSETDAPLIVDRNRVLPDAVPIESVKSIPGRNPQVLQSYRQIQIFKLANCPFGYVRGKQFRFPCDIQISGALVCERLIISTVFCHVTNVNLGCPLSVGRSVA